MMFFNRFINKSVLRIVSLIIILLSSVLLVFVFRKNDDRMFDRVSLQQRPPQPPVLQTPENFWSGLQPFLKSTTIRLGTIDGKYDLIPLAKDKDKDYDALSEGSKDIIGDLIGDKKTAEWVQTQIEEKNKFNLEYWLKNMQFAFLTMTGTEVSNFFSEHKNLSSTGCDEYSDILEPIVFPISLDNLIKPENFGKTLTELVPEAKKELQTLEDCLNDIKSPMNDFFDKGWEEPNYWAVLKQLLRSYNGFAFASIRITYKDDDLDIDISNSFGIDRIFSERNNNFADLSDEVKAQLKALIDDKIPTRVFLEHLEQKRKDNIPLLNNKWDELKTELSTYSGFQSDSVKINSETYFLTDLWNKVSSTDIGSAFKDSALNQLQELINGEVSWNQIKTELDKLNDKKLDTLWINILELFKQKGGSFTDSIVFKDKSYPFKLIGNSVGVTQFKNSPGSSLTTDVKEQLQTLVNNGVTAKDIETYIDSLKKEAEAAKEEKSTKNQNLAIGLGTAGGVVVLAGAGGFVYWFIKVRK